MKIEPLWTVQKETASATFVFGQGDEEVWIKAVLGQWGPEERSGSFVCSFRFIGWRSSVVRTVSGPSPLHVIHHAIELIWAELAVMSHHFGSEASTASDGMPLDLSAFENLVKGLQEHDERRYESAIRLLTPYAALGVPECQAILASCYHFGFGVKADLKESARLYRLAAAQGDGIACQNLSVILLQGAEGVEEDPREAKRLSELAWQLGLERVARR